MSWNIVQLNSIFKIARGGSPRPINNYLTEDKEGVNWIMIGDTESGKKYINSTAKKIKKEGVSKSRIVFKGDFLLTNSMSFGRPYILNIDGCIHDGWLVLSPINENISTDYFYFYLGSNEIKSRLASMASGAVVKNLNKDIVSSLKIPLPPLEEQKKIAAILDAADDYRQKTKALIDKYDELTQSLFLDMFGDPVTNPLGWEKVPMGELMNIVRGGSPRPIEKFLGGDFPWIKIGDATNGDDIYLNKTKQHIIEAGLKKTRLLPKDSLIFANCGVSLGFARIITFEGCIHDGWLAFNKIDKSLSKLFLLKALNSITRYFRETAPDGTQPNLNSGIMKSFKIIRPPIELQNEFEQNLLLLTEQKQQAEASLVKAEELFSSLLQRAFKGGLTN